MNEDKGLGVTSKAVGGIQTVEGKDGNFQLMSKEINVPADMVYKISNKSGGYYASLYDLMAREIGMQWLKTEILYQDEYKVKLHIWCQYWNKAGRLAKDDEIYEVDARLMYEKSRFGYERKAVDGKGAWIKEGRGYKIAESGKESTKVIRDPKHPENPPLVIVKLSDQAETELYEKYLTLRRNLLSKTITCCHRRLIQRAVGIKNFTIKDTRDDNWDKNLSVDVYGFLPANVDKEAGIQAVEDITGEELPAEKIPVAKEKIPVAKKKAATSIPIGTTAERKPVEKKEGREGFGKCSNPDCAKEITDKAVVDFSLGRYKRILCRDCQKIMNPQGD